MFPSTDALLSVRRMVMKVRLKGWVNWSGLETLVTDVPDLVASSLNRLVARQPLWQNDADDLTRERPVL